MHSHPTSRRPTPPGEILLEEYLKPSGLTQIALAGKMRIPIQRLNGVIRGKRAVTAETALALAGAFNTTPEFWMNLQVGVDLWEARQRLERRVGGRPPPSSRKRESRA